MPRPGIFAIAAGLLALTAVTAAAQGDGREQHVFVGVTTSSGAPVATVTAKDLVVREDGTAREIIRIDPAPPPSHIALLVDTSGAATSLIAELRDGVSRFVQAISGLDPRPAISVVSFGERPTVESPFTSSLPLVAQAVVRLFPRPNSGAYLLDAIVETAGRMSSLDTRGAAIVAFTVAGGEEFSDIRAARVADAVREAGVSLWVVELGSTGTAATPDTIERDKTIADVTRDSGGRHELVLSRLGIDAGFAAVAAGLVNRYDVVYGRPDTLVPPTRVAVETTNRQWRVVAPRWTRR